jgi:hypothetical protein
MKEILSSIEIKEQFDSEWVLVGDPEIDENFSVKRGVVLYHSKDRDEVYRKAREIKPKHSAFLYTGKIPEGEAIVL